MKVAVYDRFWSTAGGGEKFAGGIAEVLSRNHDVDLLAPEPIDVVALGEYLSLDLQRVGVRVVGSDLFGVETASADYDLLVNASYTSTDICRAGHGLYVVHFPGPIGGSGPAVRVRRAVAGRLTSSQRSVEMGTGFYAPERMLQRWGAWTAGSGLVRLFLPERGSTRVTVELARIMPSPEVSEMPVEVRVGGEVVARADVARPDRRLAWRAVPVSFEVEGAGPGTPVEVRIESPTAAAPDTSRRQLGVAVVGVRLGRGPAARLRAWYPWLAGARPWAGFLSSYDEVVANSEFTRRHIEAAWEVPAGLLNPPVTMFEPGEKEPMIVSVGRFFAAHDGHSKKQLEMVRAFADLCRRVDGWSLHLVGGVDDDGAGYLDQVLAAAEGLAVSVHPNASTAELSDLYARASIYWHATGLGESLTRHPDRFEHFGITTVEAMSAAAVPVVIGCAGQLETVEHGRTGYHWSTPEELVETTASLIADDGRRERIAAAAADAARDFSFDAFAARLDSLVDAVCAR